MKKIFLKKSLQKGGGLFAFILLSACASGPSSLQESYKPSAPYKRTIELTVDHPQIQSLLEQKILKTRDYILQPKNGFSEFHIVVDTHINRIKSLEVKPLLLGRIQKTKTPVSFKAHYKINNHTNLTLAEGRFSETTETTARIYPALTLTKKIKATAANTLADKILKEARSHIAATTWSTRVTSTKDKQHVSIAIGEESGLELGDTFITESQPVAKLQVVLFENMSTGQNRAILGLLEGFLPDPGRKLIPTK
jgi:hypothetical protein